MLQKNSKGRAEGVLRDQVRQLGMYFRFVWTTYIRWFTVFLTVNLAALAFHDGVSTYGTFLAVAFLVFNVLGTVTSFRVHRYTRRTAAAIEESRDALWAACGLEGDSRYRKTHPGSTASMGALFNALASVVLAVLWTIILSLEYPSS